MTIGRIPSVEGGIQPTIVDAKGDLIAGVAADSVNRLAVGSNDQVLVADSSTSTGLAWKSYAAQFVAGKNAIINGAFDFWQRGTSFTTGYTADRWLLQPGSGATVTCSRQTFTPGTAPVSGYESQYFYRINRSVTGSAETYWGTRLEDVRLFAGQTVTLSFWAKASSTFSASAGDVYLLQNFGSGGSAAVGITNTSAFTVTTSWQRFSFTVAIPSISGKTVGTSSYLELTWYFPTAKSTFTIDTWGWQLEAGSVATPFTTATGTLQGELAACQRYYYRTGAGSNDPLAVGAFATSTICNGITTFPVTMRTRPTALEQSGTASDYRLLFNNGNATCSAVPTFEQASPTMARIRFDIASGGTAGGGATFASNASNGYLGWSAEL